MKARDDEMPVGVFLKNHAAPNSFRYAGAGVKLGAADRLEYWYRTKDSKAYRAMFGDLTVKEVRAEELPLQIEKK